MDETILQRSVQWNEIRDKLYKKFDSESNIMKRRR